MTAIDWNVFPESFTDPAAELTAARSSAALFHLPAQTHVEIQGQDRARFLHNFCTNDIKGLAPGSGCELFITSIQGKVLGHFFAFAGAHALWLSGAPGQGKSTVRHLAKYQIHEDVSFHDRTGEWETLLLAGPQALGVVDNLFGMSFRIDRPLNHAETVWSGLPVSVRHNDFLKLPAFELVLPAAGAAALWGELSREARPAGAAAFHALRIEACFPLYGVDLTSANLAQEAGRTERAISFKKGCYLGQEPIARIDALGHVNQQVVGIRLRGEAAPAAGADVAAEDDEQKIIGQVTSSVFSALSRQPVCLACLRRQYTAPGTTVRVRGNQGWLAGIVFV